VRREVGARDQRQHDEDERLDDHDQRALGEPTGDQRDAADGGDEEAVEHAAVEVVQQRHAAPPAREQRAHDDDARCQEVEVRAGPEARDLDHALEQGAVEQQPDQRLHERDEDPDGLPEQAPDVPDRHVVGVGDGGHRSASANVRPAWRR
jgi:hypothetical protein